MQPLLKAENITKTYKTGDVDVQALKGVSFTIEDGELIVVLGPSGSGKSTMLNILGGIETATSGNIFYEGEPLDWSDRNALSDYRRAHIGFVFQFYNLLPGLTALENIELSGELSQAPLDAKKLIGRSAWQTAQTIIPAVFPAASSSASPSPEPFARTRTSCCATNLPAPWTPRPASRSQNCCGISAGNTIRPWSSSPTTRASPASPTG